ncbi:MAG: hypothetical protein ACYSW7_08050 [Planctomycetota bacterium]|jgi:hypothetical protein
MNEILFSRRLWVTTVGGIHTAGRDPPFATISDTTGMRKIMNNFMVLGARKKGVI